MSNENQHNIWIQPGTRLHMLVYRPYRETWQVWTATDSRQGSSMQWKGTYMELFTNGKCMQHLRTEAEESVICVREAAYFTYERTRKDHRSRWIVYTMDNSGAMTANSQHDTYTQAVRHAHDKLVDKQWTICEERCVTRSDQLNTTGER